MSKSVKTRKFILLHKMTIYCTIIRLEAVGAVLSKVGVPKVLSSIPLLVTDGLCNSHLVRWLLK